MDEFEVALILDTTVPVKWTVEAVNVDGDGCVSDATFTGHEAELRAREYALWKYGALSPDVLVA